MVIEIIPGKVSFTEVVPKFTVFSQQTNENFLGLWSALEILLHKYFVYKINANYMGGIIIIYSPESISS